MTLPPSMVTLVPRPLLPPGAPSTGTKTRWLLHPRLELGEFEKAASVERQILDLAVGDHVADGVGIIVHLRRGGVHRHRLGYFAHTQREVRGCGCACFDQRRTDKPLKTRCLGTDLVFAG